MKAELKNAAYSLLSVASAAALGALLSADTEKNALSSNLPRFAPPAAVLPILWAVLYLLTGYAFYLALSARQPDPYARRGTVVTFLCGLLLSALWPMVFFRFQFFRLAFYLLIALLILGAFTQADFYKASRRAALCYLPYLGWLVFALLLTYAAARRSS